MAAEAQCSAGTPNTLVAGRPAAVQWYRTVHTYLFGSSVCTPSLPSNHQRILHRLESRVWAANQTTPECHNLQIRCGWKLENKDQCSAHKVDNHSSSLLTRGARGVASVLCTAALLMGSPGIAYGAERGAFVRPERSGPIIDGANIIPDGREGELANGLAEFADQTGWKIRKPTSSAQISFHFRWSSGESG